MRRISLAVSVVLVFVLLNVILVPTVQATDGADRSTFSKTGNFGGIVIYCGSEDIVVKQEGSEFLVELDAPRADSYQIRDNRGIPMCERFFYYNKWDIIFERADRESKTAKYASTIIITVPEGLESLLLRTGSGSIQASGLDGLYLTLDSSGDATIKDSVVGYVDARVGGRLELDNVKASEDVIINYKSYKDDSSYLRDGVYTIVKGNNSKS